MLVRMLARWAGEQGVAQPGDVVAMSTEAAQELVSRGFAEFLETSGPECAELPEAEVAVVETKKRRKKREA